MRFELRLIAAAFLLLLLLAASGRNQAIAAMPATLTANAVAR